MSNFALPEVHFCYGGQCFSLVAGNGGNSSGKVSIIGPVVGLVQWRAAATRWRNAQEEEEDDDGARNGPRHSAALPVISVRNEWNVAALCTVVVKFSLRVQFYGCAIGNYCNFCLRFFDVNIINLVVSVQPD